jgi:hypothetical protein
MEIIEQPNYINNPTPTHSEIKNFCSYIRNESHILSHITKLNEQVLFEKFIIASDEQRADISSIISGGRLWENQLQRLVNEYAHEPAEAINH